MRTGFRIWNAEFCNADWLQWYNCGQLFAAPVFLHNFITCCGQKLTQISPNSIKNRRFNIAPGFCKNMTCWEISTERKFDPLSVWPPIFTFASLLANMSAWPSIDWFWIEKSFTVLNLQSIFRDSKKGLALYWHRLWPPVNPFNLQNAYKNTNLYIWSEGIYSSNQNVLSEILCESLVSLYSLYLIPITFAKFGLDPQWKEHK